MSLNQQPSRGRRVVSRLGQVPLCSFLFLLLIGLQLPAHATGYLLDNNIDPYNLGKGDWIWLMNSCTNASRPTPNAVLDYEKSHGMTWVTVKCGPSFPQFNSSLVNYAHTIGLKIFGWAYLYGVDVQSEINTATACLALGADGFIIDGEIEYETNNFNNMSAIRMCQAVQAAYPTRFLAHAPFPYISSHSGFPYTEFGLYCDAVMPQDYWKDIGVSATTMVANMDSQWNAWQNGLSGFKTNAILPIIPIGQGWDLASTNLTTGLEITNFFTALSTDANPASKGGYHGVSWWSCQHHTTAHWTALGGNSIDATDTAPAIARAPLSRSVDQGVATKFQVTAYGAMPLSYQWRIDGVNIALATNASYTISSAQSSQAGNYSVVISNSLGSITSANAKLTVNASSFLQLAFSDNFDSSNSLSAWSIYQGSGNGVSDYTAVFGFDYSTQKFTVLGMTNLTTYLTNTVAVAPGTTNGTRNGLKLTVNKNDATAATAGVSLYPTGMNFGSNYVLRYDMWINYNGGPGGGNGSTEYATCGLNHTGTRVNWITNGTAASDGLWFAVDGDGGSGANDYRAYQGGAPTELSFSTNGFSANGAQSQNYLDTFFGNLFPAATYETPGQPGKHWVAVELSQINGIITWKLNNVVVAQRTNTSSFRSGNIMLGYMDVFSSIASPAEENYLLLDNVRVYTVIDPPTLASQPSSRTNNAGTSATFNVSATGTAPLSFAWRKGLTNLVDGGNIFGSATATLTISGVTANDAGSYSIVVTNAAGTITSSNAVLTVITPPNIAAQPLTRTNIAGTTATFTVSITGTSPTFQWFKNGSPLSNGGNISGVSTAALSLTSVSQADAASYSCTASNAAGTVTSGLAGLTVIDPLSITGQPVSRTNILGTTATFSTVVTGTSPSYQWRKGGTNLPNGGTIFGATTASLTISGITANDADTYSVMVTNPAGASVSSNAVLTVITPPTMAAQPFARTNIAGTTATFAVSITGTSPTVQWLKNGSPLSNAGNISGVSTAALSLASVSQADAASYSCIASNAAGSVTSDLAGLTVIDPVSITGQPVSRTNVLGTSATFSVLVAGTSPSYQWRKDGVALADGPTISGAATSILTLTTVAQNDAGNYSVLLNNAAGSIASSVALLTVIAPPSITSQPQSLTVSAGANATFQVALAGTGPLQYQWLFNGTNLAGATSSVYTRLNTQPPHAGDYTVVIANSAGSVTSDVAHLTVNISVFISEQPQDKTLAQGDNALFEVQPGGTPPFNFQWQFNGNPVTGATDSSFQKTNVLPEDAGNYSVIVSNAMGRVTSANALLTVLVPPTISINPLSQSVTNGSNVTFSVSAIGTAPLIYSWQWNGSDVTSGTNSTFTLVNVNTNQAGSYSVIVSNSVGMASSTTAQLTVFSSDSTRPKVLFTVPAANFRTNGSSLLVKGTATDNVRVTQVLYRVGTNEYQPTQGMSNWSAVVSLTPGTNVVTVKAIDAAGNEYVTNRSFFFVVPWPMTIATNGLGKVTGVTNGQVLEIGRNYSMTAVPIAGNVFTNWTGDIYGTNPLIVFRMQTNLVANANFIPSPFIGAAGIYNGLFSESIVTHQSAGFVSLSVSSNQAFSGRIILDGDTFSFGGRFFVPGTARVLVPRLRQGKGTLSIDLALRFGDDQLSGSISDGVWSTDLLADKNVFSKTNLAVGMMGKYTMLIPSTNDGATAPSGCGYGMINVMTNGTIQLAGALADNSIISQSVSVSKNGNWPFYAQMYLSKLIATNVSTNGTITYYTNVNYRGSVSGWLTLSNAPGLLTGTLTWIKTGWTNLFYPDGFTNVSDVLGSVYIPPSIGTRAVQITNGFAHLTDGNLSQSITSAITLKTNNLFMIVTTNRLTLSLAPTTGSLRGTFAHPDYTNKITPIAGVVLQQQRVGGGFFGGSNQFGLFQLQGAE